MTHGQAVLALWTTCLIWGLAFPLAKLALADASPMAFTAARFLAATALLVPGLRGVTRDEWRAGGILGVLLSLGFATQTVGLTLTTASRSGFITALYIPFVPLIVLVAYRTLPDRLAAAALLVALGGMTLLTSPRGLADGPNAGDLLTLLAAFCFAAHMVATGAFARRFRVERLMMSQIVVSALLTAVATPLVEAPRLSPTPILLGVVAYEAVLASVIAIRLQLAAQRVLSPTYTALVYTLEPVVAAVSSLFITGDRLTAVQWLGGGLIVIGSLLPELKSRFGRDRLWRH
jgi:drug/metabolite transporter (DMT)-like permease